MSQRWLVQVDASDVEGIELPADRREYFPAVDCKGQEPPAEDDPVVLWEMGTWAAAGAVALGYFTGPLVEKEHPVSWARPDGTWTYRLSRRIEFTHMFEARTRSPARPSSRIPVSTAGRSFALGARSVPILTR